MKLAGKLSLFRDKYRELNRNSPNDNVENGSSNATFSIFNWLRNTEEGLGFGSCSEYSSGTREFIRHPWISEEDSDNDEVLEEDQHRNEHNLSHIQEWLDDISQSTL